MKFATVAILFQILFIILFATLTRYDSDSTSFERYSTFQDVHVMIFVGFGFLMTFLKKYSFGAVGYNMFISALAIQWYLIVSGCIHHRGETGFKINLNTKSLITGDFSAAAVLITFGVVLGKVSRLQLLIVGIIEIVMFSVNEFILLEKLKISDAGGSLVIHCFGCYFGLGLSLVLRRPQDTDDHPKEGSVYHSDVFAMIGALFLWMYWPSFNGALVSPDSKPRHQYAVINTYLSLVACCVTTFATSELVSKGRPRKLNMVHIQNATLAGGVAVGTCADMAIDPWGAVLIGFLAGILSTVGYQYVTPFLNDKLHLHDTCGVNNLHGMPALLAGIAGAVAASLDNAPDAFYEDRSASKQAGYQALAIFVTLGISLVSGAITGFIVRLDVFDPPDREELFDDNNYWELPDVYVVNSESHELEVTRAQTEKASS